MHADHPLCRSTHGMWRVNPKGVTLRSISANSLDIYQTQQRNGSVKRSCKDNGSRK